MSAVTTLPLPLPERRLILTPRRGGRPWRVLVALVGLPLAGGGIGFGLASGSPEMFSAKSEVLLRLSTGSQAAADRQAATAAALVTSPPVLRAASAAQRVESSVFRNRVTATRVSGSDILRISVKAPDDAQAQLLTTAVTTAFLRELTTRAAATSTQQIKFYTDQRSQLMKRQVAVQARYDAVSQFRLRQPDATTRPISGEERRLAAELSVLPQQIATTETQITASRVRMLDESGGSLLSPAFPLGKVAPEPIRAGVVGLVVGALVAGAVVVVMTRPSLRGAN